MNELAVLFMLEIFDLQACLVKYCRAANNKTVCSCMFSAEETFLHISQNKATKTFTYLEIISISRKETKIIFQLYIIRN